MDTTIWGPPAWKFLHTITFNYPDKPNQSEIDITYLFFSSLSEMLPCKICQQHFKQYLTKYPIQDALLSRDGLINWLVNLHNHVNILLGKKTYSVREVTFTI